jgi:predicted GNAT superfamily acetyltransferase
MPDELNRGIPSDRFMVHWWINTQRVFRRLSKTSRKKLDLAHFLAADAQVINTTSLNEGGWPVPESDQMDLLEKPETQKAIVLFEVPADFQKLKASDIELAKNWRSYSRTIFELFFHHGYLATDMVYMSGKNPRSYYVLSQGNKTLGG